MEGTLIGDRYRLSQSIGFGRSGVGWIAQDVRVHRTVAAKTIPLRGPQDTAFVMQQAKHAARLKHQCAVTVYDVLAEGEDVWLITEYVPARTMAEFIRSHGGVDPLDAATLGTQLAAALAAAHEIGLLHRAVEPANVLLADDGGVQVTDFGIGALFADAAYQAPEVVAGGAHTAASDVFALGATLFYAVEGAVPFGDAQPAPSPARLTGTPLQPVLMRMLSADPGLRPTMEGVWTALRAVAAGQPAQRPPLAARAAAQPANQAQPATWMQQPTWPSAPAQPAQSGAGSLLRPSGLPSPVLIAVAVLVAVLLGVAFTELFLL